ncbi:hypothetical protein SDC9_89913 [bioreactor metagenome]|uniref:DUF1146 domain-containing protein n=1 Tax=bioreactor metagenome TaxID=1076179 RepID=A0A644ZQI6_9ZZZZ|nr:DUF1146 family protein [Erysipelotrichaceae bacterium]
MLDIIVRIILHIVSFALSWYALGCIDFARYTKPGHAKQTQVLYMLISLALGFLVAQFLLAIGFNYYSY